MAITVAAQYMGTQVSEFNYEIVKEGQYHVMIIGFHPGIEQDQSIIHTWTTLYNGFQEHNPLGVFMMTINCEQNGQLCNTLNIKQYPTILYFIGLNEIHYYDGIIDVDSIWEWLNILIGIGEEQNGEHNNDGDDVDDDDDDSNSHSHQHDDYEIVIDIVDIENTNTNNDDIVWVQDIIEESDILDIRPDIHNHHSEVLEKSQSIKLQELTEFHELLSFKVEQHQRHLASIEQSAHKIQQRIIQYQSTHQNESDWTMYLYILMTIVVITSYSIWLYSKKKYHKGVPLVM